MPTAIEPQEALAPPTIPIHFHKLLKVVAIVDGRDPQTRELLDHIEAEGFAIEVSDRLDRDVSEDAGVGAVIALIDGDRREHARRLVQVIRALGLRMPLWALADSHRVSDVAVLGLTGEVEGYIYLRQQTPAFYAKQVVASVIKYGLSLLPPFFGGLMTYDAEANFRNEGAGFSQASQIHKRDHHLRGQKRRVNHKRFAESFLMHASTSPFYPLFASLDVNAKVHEGKAGEALWDRCIELGIEVRKKLRQFGRYYAQNGRRPDEQWFFDPFVPDVVTIRSSQVAADVTDAAWEDLPTDVLKVEQQCWTLAPDRPWHGYTGYADGYAMVDPNKLTLVTPGIDRRTGEYLDFGVPATVVANFLREQRVVPEKCDLNSLLFLMTPAEDESKLNTLLAKLVKFKDLWDRNAPLAEVLPALSAAHRDRYAGYTLRRICDEMHGFYRDANIKDLQRLCFRASSFLELAMSPKDAYEALVANDVEYVPLAEVQGRIAATLALIYPPGIGVVVPGERWDEHAQPMLDYFLAFEDSFNRFPGFHYEVQGVFQERIDGRITFHTYVINEWESGARTRRRGRPCSSGR